MVIIQKYLSFFYRAIVFFVDIFRFFYSDLSFFFRKPNKQKTWPTIAFLVETRINDAFFLIKRPYKV